MAPEAKRKKQFTINVWPVSIKLVFCNEKQIYWCSYTCTRGNAEQKGDASWNINAAEKLSVIGQTFVAIQQTQPNAAVGARAGELELIAVVEDIIATRLQKSKPSSLWVRDWSRGIESKSSSVEKRRANKHAKSNNLPSKANDWSLDMGWEWWDQSPTWRRSSARPVGRETRQWLCQSEQNKPQEWE